jgi:hypothetical protein
MFEFDLTPLTQQFNGLDVDPCTDYNKDNTNTYDYENEIEDKDDSGDTADTIQKEAKSIKDRLHTTHALHPLSTDEVITYNSMLTLDDNEVFVMPNHRIDEAGILRGFRLVVERNSDCVQLPVTRQMFHGSTCVECDPGDRDIHPDVIRLLSNFHDVKQSILKTLDTIHTHKPSEMVSLEHMPVYGDVETVAVTVDDNCTGKQRSQILLENLIAERIGHHSTTMRGRDSRPWKCDMPMAVGIYHAHVRSRDSGRRHHKLFIIVSGGCRKASEQFYNMNLDLLGNATAAELESCEESWWLRRTSTRSRCKTIHMIAEALQLNVPTIRDVFAFEEGANIPVYTTDTLHHDISETDDGRISILNECCDSTKVKNGIGFNMHPTEGIWIFQGSHQSAVGNLSNFGGVFGNQEICGAFPTGTFSLYEDSYQQQNCSSYSMPVYQKSNDNPNKHHDTRLNLYREKASPHCIYFNPLNGQEVVDIAWEDRPHFVKIDEAFLKHLETHEWSREYQIIELIPIINLIETPLLGFNT